MIQFLQQSPSLSNLGEFRALGLLSPPSQSVPTSPDPNDVIDHIEVTRPQRFRSSFDPSRLLPSSEAGVGGLKSETMPLPFDWLVEIM